MLPISHQIFLQQMLKHNYLSIDETLQKLRTIEVQLAALEGNEQPNILQINLNYIKTTIRTINNLIKEQNLQLAIGKCEVTGKSSVVLFNTAHNDISETQTLYTAEELAYWVPIMDEIVKSGTNSINKITCLNLVNERKLPIKLHDAEDFLEKCVKKGYLVSKAGEYYLGTTTLLEFNNHLRTAYREYVEICELCSEICCYGKSCSKCDKLMHEHCLKTVLKTNKPLCPLCNETWQSADTESSQSSINGSMQNNSIPSTDDDEDMVEVSPKSVASTSTRSRPKRL